MLAYLYFSGGGVAQNHAKALRWSQKAAKQGHAETQFNIGFMYSYGVGVPQDEKIASAWFQKAGEQDDEAAPLFAALQMHLKWSVGGGRCGYDEYPPPKIRLPAH